MRCEPWCPPGLDHTQLTRTRTSSSGDRIYLELYGTGLIKFAITIILCVAPFFPICGLFYLHEDERGAYCTQSYAMASVTSLLGIGWGCWVG